jgi:hypothetical protein
MTESEVKTAKSKLESLNFIAIKRKGLPAKTYYKVNESIIIKCLTRVGKSSELESRNPRNKSRGIPKTIYKETEKTTKKKTDTPAEAGKKEKNYPDQTDKLPSGKIKMSAIEKSNRVDKPKKILPNEYLAILEAYKKNINANCNARTAAVVENIPKTVKKFEEFFGSSAQEKFILAIKTFLASGNWRDWMLKNPGAKTPKTFLSVKFAENHLIPLVTNTSKNEYLSETPLSEEELRKIEEDTARRLKEATADDYKREDT